MTVPARDDRRAVPRFKVWVGCSVLVRLSDEEFREKAVLGYVKDLSREAVGVVLPEHETFGVDAGHVGKQVLLNLALPVGYVRLSATFVRDAPDDSGKHLFVFKIQESNERDKYEEYLASLQAE